MTKARATIRFVGSLIWLAGIGYLFYIVQVVSQGGGDPDRDILFFGDKFNVIMCIGFVGLLQSSVFVKTFFGCVFGGLNTRVDNVYIDAAGREVEREMDGGSTLIGWIFSFFLGFILMFVTSALGGPFVFCYNLFHFFDAWTRETSFAFLFRFISILLICGMLAATYFGGKWLYIQVDAIGHYKANKTSHSYQMEKIIVEEAPGELVRNNS